MIEALQYLVIIFGYIALLVFILGLAYWIWHWGRLPSDPRWRLFPQPTKSTTSSFLFGRILILPTLLKSYKLLIVAIVMHIAILASVVLHLELFAHLGAENVIDTIGSSAGIVAVPLVGYFVFRRYIVKAVRELSSFGDYFWLPFLLIVVAIGAYLRVFNIVDPEVYRTFAISVITLNPILPPPNLWFLIHAFLGEIYLMYIVSGKMMHSIGWLFTQHILVSK